MRYNCFRAEAMVVGILNRRSKGFGGENESIHRDSFQIDFRLKHSIDGPTQTEQKFHSQGSLHSEDIFILVWGF